MAILLVEHDTTEPALYGAMAAAVAQGRGARLVHLTAVFDTRRYADAVQHIAAIGALVPSGLVLAERLLEIDVGREASLEDVVSFARNGDVVVPWHRRVAADGRAAALLSEQAAASGITVEHVAIVEEDGGLRVRGHPERLWRRDRFGRLEAAQPGGQAPQREAVLRIALIGTEGDHRHVYPADLAALGDAGDAEGVDIDVTFVAPPALRPQDVGGVLDEVDGILLPGGSDMANVPGQILMAAGALRRLTPAIGLCLGMQTMTTAVARQALGSKNANLAEADPSAPIKTFTPLSEDGSLPAHRLGEKTITVAARSRLRGLLGAETRIRCNHRFRLNPELEPVLAGAGLMISARDESGLITDAIELADHPFYCGIQGHPELTSRPDAPHPLIRAFVRACRWRL
jgi:CTP synthase